MLFTEYVFQKDIDRAGMQWLCGGGRWMGGGIMHDRVYETSCLKPDRAEADC